MSSLNRPVSSVNSKRMAKKRRTIDIQDASCESFKLTVPGPDRKPHSYDIRLPNGIKPYSCQKLMFIKVLTSLNNRLNALIESPTGSGKTLSLLAATCSWLEQYNARRLISKENCPRHGYRRLSSTQSAVLTNTNTTLSSNKTMIETGDSYLDNSNMDVSLSEYKDASMLSVVSENTPLKAFNRSALDVKLEEEFASDFIEPDVKRLLSQFGDIKKEIEDDEDLSSFQHSMLNDEKPDGSAVKLPECTCDPSITIYYGTRTHKQIAQVVKEFSRLPYGQDGTLRHTILASREISCINENIKSMPGDLSTNCKNALNADQVHNRCAYKENMRDIQQPGQVRSMIKRSNKGDVWDMEDLVNLLQHTRPQICPYFTSTRLLTKDADIVFTPFNYLLDPIIRNNSNVNTKNAIVIFDEGHNVEDVSRDSASFVFRERDLIQAFDHIEEKHNEFLTDKRNPVMENYLQREVELRTLCNNMEAGYLEIVHFYKMFYAWFKKIGNEVLSSSENTQTFGWEYLRNSLASDAPYLLEIGTRDNEKYKMLLTSISNVMEKNPNNLYEEFIGHLRPLGYSIVPMEKFLYFIDYYCKIDYKYAEAYRCNVKFEPASHEFSPTSRNKENVFRRGSNPAWQGPRLIEEGSQIWHGSQPKIKYEPIRKGYDTIINLWCMTPTVTFMDAVGEARSVILASGTLCPIDTLVTELGLNFKHNMEGKQIIPKDQIFASSISKGPTSVSLCAVYKNVQEGSPFISDLAQIIVRTCRIVPKGVLCFLSSYRILEFMYNYLTNHQKLWSELCRFKRVVVEPRRGSELSSVMDDYEYAVNNPRTFGMDCTGALMLAVFRGKVSEGIDFTDDKARCVICVGIPFPNAMDELVIQKKAYNNGHCKTSKIPSGNEWYSIQAYRALNQALGRCLRHINDWGALVLVDDRFERNARLNKSEFSKISGWVRDNLVNYEVFTRFEEDLIKFVRRQEERTHSSEIKAETIDSGDLRLPPARKNIRRKNPVIDF